MRKITTALQQSITLESLFKLATPDLSSEKLVVTLTVFLNKHKEGRLMRQHRNKHHSWEQKLNEKGLQPVLLLWKTILLKCNK